MEIEDAPNSSDPLSESDPEEREREYAVLSQVILELNIARKNFAIYPLGHRQIEFSVNRVYDQLAGILNSRTELNFGAAKGSIYTDSYQLEFKKPGHRDFSIALHSLNIAAISFVNGLSKQEVFDFLKAISSEVEVRDGCSQIFLSMNHAGIEHIRIEAIDYDLFSLTEESEIVASDYSKKLTPVDLWHEFIRNLFSEQRLDIVRRNHLVRMRPSEIVAEINDRKIDLVIVQQNFRKIFANASMPAIQNQLDKRMDTLLKNLQPEIRQQFLSISFDAVSNGEVNTLENYSNEMVMEMLQHANSQNKQLSPSLVNLLEKLSRSQESMPLHIAKKDAVTSDADSPAPKEYLQKLLDREFYENYVDDSYAAMLRQLGKESFQAGTPHQELSSKTDQQEMLQDLKSYNGSSDSESYLNIFDADVLDLRIAAMSLCLLDQDLPIADYTGFAEKLVMEAVRLIDIGALDVVLMMVQTFQRHAQEKSGAFQPVAQECLQKLTISDVTSRVLLMFNEGSTDHLGVASNILSAFGKSVIPGIMDLFIESQSPIVSRAISELLNGFGMDSLEEAYLRLQDSRIPVLRKILAFIRKTGSTASIAHIRPLISHDDPLVRLEAATALLNLQDPDAPAILCRSFRSADHLERSGAIQLAGYYRVGEVTGELSAMLIKSPWRKADYRNNVTIIKSLGKIGDSCVLPVLEKLAGKSLAIYPEELRKMKLAIFESLIGYPRESLSRILCIGRQTDDYRIQDICKALS